MAEVGRRMKPEVTYHRVRHYRQAERVSLDTMKRIAAAFEVDEDYFLEVRMDKLNQQIKADPQLLEDFQTYRRMISERTTGFEPATNSLEGCDSTNWRSNDREAIIAEASRHWIQPELGLKTLPATNPDQLGLRIDEKHPIVQEEVA